LDGFYNASQVSIVSNLSQDAELPVFFFKAFLTIHSTYTDKDSHL
jgi:hypothetical protein